MVDEIGSTQICSVTLSPEVAVLSRALGRTEPNRLVRPHLV